MPALAVSLGPSAQRLAVQKDLAAAPDRAGDGSERGRLARTVRAEDCDHRPLGHLERDTTERLDRPVAGLHVAQLEEGVHVPSSLPRYASITSGFVRTSAGVPSAILRPKLSTLTWSEIRITRLMWCSTSSTVSSWSCANTQDEVAELFHLLVVEATGRLVEQEETRLRGQRPRDLDPLLDPVGQGGRALVGSWPQTDVVEQGARLLLPELSATCMGADEDVLEHRHRREQVDVLERACNPAFDDPVRRCLQQRLAVEGEFAVVRRVQAGDDVERCRLASAVRPDQAGDLARLDVE